MSARKTKFLKGGQKRRHSGHQTNVVRKAWWRRDWFIATLMGGYDTRTWGLKSGEAPRRSSEKHS